MIMTHKKGKYNAEARYTELVESGRQLENELEVINKRLLDANLAGMEKIKKILGYHMQLNL